jgi:hypothetical protein
MKIRKASLLNEKELSNVYIYENKKEEYFVIAAPDLEWSIRIDYEEESEALRNRLAASLEKKLSPELSEELVSKILFWTREM